jgi:peroxiredoxin-like protein
MKPLPHRYEVHLTGSQSGYAELNVPAIPLLRTAPPPEYDGPGDAWSPEHLLLAAVESCFIFTLRAVARMSQVEFASLDLHAVGVVDRRDRVTRFTEIILRPRVTVRAGTERERVIHVLEKTEKACLVSASLSTPVRLEPQIIGEDSAATPGEKGEAA